MPKWKAILFCILFSCMVVCSSFGYAQYTTTLFVEGTLIEPEVVYITDVKVNGKTNTSGSNPAVTCTGMLTFTHNGYSLNQQQWGGAGGSVTIEVTVKNNSGIDQYFGYHSTTNQKDTRLNNATITYGQSGDGRLVKQGEIKKFTFTIQNSSWSSISMNGFESLLVFSPNFTNDDTENATNTLAQIFANVLAGTGPNGDNVGITYQGKQIAANKIMEEITKKMTDVDTGGYTGNVGNATQDEKDLMAAIFGDNIVIQIGNNYYSVYILIKNQQIDGKGENDMVIYITADQLNMGSGGWSNNAYRNLNIVPVYGLVFIKNGNNYTYCDHLFAGEAPVCDFGGAFGEGKVGNFNTNLWNSTEFNVSDNSGGDITADYITKNGELDEAYQYFVNKK